MKEKKRKEKKRKRKEKKRKEKKRENKRKQQNTIKFKWVIILVCMQINMSD